MLRPMRYVGYAVAALLIYPYTVWMKVPVL
jgi:hypothetical protein